VPQLISALLPDVENPAKAGFFMAVKKIPKRLASFLHHCALTGASLLMLQLAGLFETQPKKTMFNVRYIKLYEIMLC